MYRRKGGRTYRKRTSAERMDLLERRVSRLEEAVGVKDEVPEGGCSTCDDLVGCLDDMVTDVKDLRKRVRDVRS